MLRILLRVSALPALAIASSLILVVTILLSVLLTEHTLQFHELGEFQMRSPEFRCILLALWSTAMSPAMRMGLSAPGTQYLRWLPISSGGFIGFFVLLLATLDGGIAAPLLSAGYLLPGICVGLSSMMLTTCLLPGGARIGASIASFLIALLLLWLVFEGIWMPASALATAGIAWRLPFAWKHGLGSRASRPSRQRPFIKGRALAIARIQVVLVFRREVATLLKLLLLSSLGIILINLVYPSNTEAPSTEALLVMTTPVLSTASLILALALKRSRNELCPLCRSIGVSLRVERVCSLGIVGLSSASIALISSLSSGGTCLETMILMAYGGAWATVAVRLSSLSREAIHAVARTFALTLIAMTAIGLMGIWSMAAITAISLMFGAAPIVLRDLPDA